ncbi:MAG: hypothetical protein IJF53_01640 [Clostridia bacterium]|nr:hypothetical protein [Clostridia bacterium]
MFELIFFGFPFAALIAWVACLNRYSTMKKEYKEDPALVSEKDLKLARMWTYISGVVALAPVAVVVGFIVLIYTGAIAFM